MRHEVIRRGPISDTVVHFNDEEMITEDRMYPHVVQSILDANAVARNDNLHNPMAHGRKVASIPIAIWHNWKKEWRAGAREKWRWQTFLAMKLNSSEWAYLRTINGKI